MKWFLTFMILLLSISNLVCAQSRAQDSLALVALYNSTNGTNWRMNANWLSANPMDTWYGITLDAQGRVNCIDLDGAVGCSRLISAGGNNLIGSLPISLNNLTNLQYLSLSNNQLNGTIPNFNLPNLQQLELGDNNQLTGSIPNFNLPNLQQLKLYNNQLTGSIPNFNLPNLQELKLYNNQLTGSIPNLNLPNLQQLELDGNQLTGSIPNFNLPNLQQLKLYGNQLTGNIPNFNLPNLQYIKLSSNQLSGNIPRFNLPNLKFLHFRSNQLTGSIPNFNLPNLQYLELGSNQLSGNIPNFNLPNLQYLELNFNQLTGSIPNFNLPNLLFLHLESNQLTGNIPDFSLLPNLTSFSVNFNQLTGNIPNFNLLNLQTLYLYSNQLSGRIPNFILPNLQTLWLGRNQLSSSVPNFNSLPNLRWFGFNSTQIDSLPNLFALTNLTQFKADTNRLTFDDILPNIPKGITYTKQDSIFKDTTYSKLIGQPLVINLGIDGALTTNVYNWYKNGSFYQTTGVNQLVFNSLTSVDGGIYTCRVTNPGAPALTLYSRNATVRVTDPLRYADSLALVALYDSTNGTNWRYKTNWLSANPMNTWYGIGLDAQGLVDSIFLYDNSLFGTLPSNFGIGNLSKLRIIDLVLNRLRGNVPNFNLPNLKYLFLAGNELTGIPNFNLPNLESLEIGTNQLNDTIPNFNLPKLRELYLDNNQLRGSIPRFDLPQLTSLNLEKNQLNGSIPSFRLPSLRTLKLGSNQLTGNIPNFSLNLSWLDLSYNQLSGSILNFTYPNLTNMYLGHNQLSGNFPTSNLPNLRGVGIDSTLIDSLPNLSAWTALTTFKADTNKLTFDDILPNLPRGITYTKQDSIFRDTTYSKVTNESFVINLGIDGALTTNKYKWYKNGILYDSTTVNQLVFNRLNLANAGLYTCEVTNPGAPLLTLYSRKITLQVGCAPPRDTAFSASLCIGQNYRLPSGRTVNTLGSHRDTLKSIANTTCDSVRYTISLVNDTGGRCADSLVLVELYDSTNGANWRPSFDGRQNSPWTLVRPMTTWHGIILNAQGRVDKIVLNDDSLRGTLPTSLNNLTNLTSLNLSNNRLTGSIPNFNLPNLQWLNLYSNQLSGNIPNFNLLSNLRELSLQHNQLTGNIPNFNLFPNLRAITLNNNQLSGNIPNFNLPNLRELWLTSNKLTGSIPDFNNLPNLQYFWIGHNQLSGSVPNFNSLSNLNWFRFDSNRIDSLPNLSRFSLTPSWFKADTNKLTFDDILPNLSRGITYTKQDSIFRDTTYSKVTNESLVINLGIDGALTTNVYKWYKDGSLYQMDSVNQLVFNHLNLSDAGLYTCEVTNRFAPALTLYSRKITVQVGCAPPRDTAFTALLCLNPIRLPSGRTVHALGTYLDTVRSVLSPSCDSVRATVNVVTDYPCRDSLALVQFYIETQGQNWLNHRNWRTATRLEDWQGVDLDAQGRVYNLRLPNNNLRESLSTVLDTLTHLEFLDFANNHLTGNIPNLNLPALTALYLDLNRFDGNLPIFNLPNCQTIYLDNNLLVGKMPLFNTPRLKQLRFSNNQIDSLPNLSRFALQECAAQVNRLTFDDILPNRAFQIQYLAQDSIFKDTTFLQNVGTALTIDLGIDRGIFDNAYKWFKNGAFYRNTSTNQLIFNPLKATDAGIYTCEITNLSAPNLTLYSRKATVTVTCPVLRRNLSASFCQGHFYTLPTGRITTVGGTFRDTVPSWLGCDSVVNSVVTVLPIPINRLPIEYDCAIAQTRLDTTLLMNRNGCDSIVIRTRIAARNTTELPLQYRCNPNDTATQTRRLTNQYGCDSIVNQRFALATSYNRTVTNWVCSPAQVGVRTTRDTTYWGCDSIVTTRTLLARKDSLNFLIIECNIRDTGTIRKALTNQFGCDSIVIERHRLVKKDTLVKSNIVCDTLFERMDTTLLKNRHNCDSLVIKHYVFDHCVCLKENKIYNGLIPNDADNQNDYFNIPFIERYQPNELIITDKRGTIVYRTPNYRNSWTGTFQNGDPLPEGIYDYVFRTRHPVTQKECLRIGTLTITYIP